jgi:Fe-S-cluster containining protein
MKDKKQSLKELMDERQKELSDNLEETKKILIDDLASQIRAIGFECLRCGDCCIGENNSVVVFPIEIRKILAAKCIGWLDAVEPPSVGEWDCQGSFHTLEWRIKKESGSCKFYAESWCKIYQDRPMLCKTYPFYLEEGILRCSLCRGLGGKIESDEAKEIAALVKKRSITEIQEAMALLERYQDFERGHRSEKGACIVHDSEGEHRIAWKDLPDFLPESEMTNRHQSTD